MKYSTCPAPQKAPIAIVGIGCRYPKGIDSPETFWQFISRGKDGITEIPESRWDINAYYDSDQEKPGKIFVKKGGFLDNIDRFDPQFFGISPREAAFMDPQQRLLLEVTWEAMEDAGIPPETVAGKKVAVFVGLFMHDYENIHIASSEHKLLGPHSPTGMSTTISANRLSYVFDFKGPSTIIDTACSSSLVATHLACRSILDEDAEMAIAGGVNLIMKPEMTMALCRGSFLNPEGYCRSFDARGAGYSRAEGCGVVVLKSLKKAQADGDPIYAIIKGTAVNQDGRSEGLTVPNGEAQKVAIWDALSRAGIAPKEVQYVEAHGTGTPTGDPIEAKAIGEVFRENREKGQKTIIGSVKSNFGHTESAAGIAGLIKASLMLKHGMIPPNLHFETPNPRIAFDDLKIRIPTELEKWPETVNKKRVAGVNSFGFGGTNSHVVLESYSPKQGVGKRPSRMVSNADSICCMPITAQTNEALRAAAEALSIFVKTNIEDRHIALKDIGYSLSQRKGQHRHRLSVTVNSTTKLYRMLDAYVAGEKRLGMNTGVPGREALGKCAFVFAGMGPQWFGMGRELYQKERVFRDVIDKCDALFKKHTTEWSLLDELRVKETESHIQETQIAQPRIFSLQVGLAELWRTWGVEPDATIGHSVGEIAAIHVTGILNLEDAVAVCYHRSRLQQQVTGAGRMLAVGLTEGQAQEWIEKYSGKISIAAQNSPSSITLSGDSSALEEVAGALDEKNVFARFLRVDVPYHSPAMDPILEELREALKDIRPRKNDTPLYSTVSGGIAHWKEITADYWTRNAREPVRFAEAFCELIRSNHEVFLEISAHPVLAMSMQENLAQQQEKGTIVASLRRKEPEDVVMLSGIGQLYNVGYPVDWGRFYKPDECRFIKLPAYPWQRELYWHESEESQQARKGNHHFSGNAMIGKQVHPLLGGRLASAVPSWTNSIDMSQLSYLKGHVVQGSIVFPGAGYLEMGFAVASSKLATNTVCLTDVEIKAPLIMNEDSPSIVQVVSNDEGSFSVYSKLDGGEEWGLHAQGKFSQTRRGDAETQTSLEEIVARLQQTKDKESCYSDFRGKGLMYSPPFDCVDQIWFNDREALGQINADGLDTSSYLLHPAILDGCFQIMACLPMEGTYLPVRVAKVQLHKAIEGNLWAHATLTKHSRNMIKGDILLGNDSGEILAEVIGFQCKRVVDALSADPESIHGIVYEYQWILDKTNLASADFMPTPQEIANQTRSYATELAEQLNQWQYYEEVEPAMNQLCTAYILNALKKSDWDLQQPLATEEIANKIGVASNQKRFFQRLLQILELHGILKKEHGQWHVLEIPEKIDPARLWREMLFRYPAYQAEWTILQRCGLKIPEVLLEEADPLELIFPHGSQFATQLYQDSPTFRLYNHIVGQVLAAILDRMPEGRPLRILEIGGGKGGMTSHVLPLLSQSMTEYVFTDISPLFVNQAAEKYQEYGFLQCKTLNIEKDPIAQDFQPRSFDVILASDVIHATTELKHTLNNVKTLLASNGALVLLETTSRPYWFDLTFGMLSGWWLFKDFDIRTANPLLSQKEWFSVLTDSGFSNVAKVSDPVEGRDPLNSVIIAQFERMRETENVSGNDMPLEIQSDDTWIVFEDGMGISGQLIIQLKEKGIKPIQVQYGDALKVQRNLNAVVRANNLKDIEAMFDKYCGDSEDAPNIVFCSSEGADEQLNDIGRTTTNKCTKLLLLIQAVAKRNWGSKPSVWVTTNGTQPVGGVDRISLSQIPLWGVLRVAITEHADIQMHAVDLSTEPTAREIRSLCNLLLSNTVEDEITLREDKVFFHRLVRRLQNPRSRGNAVPYTFASKATGRFHFEEMQRKQPKGNEVEIRVKAAGLNFKDMAKFTGLLDSSVFEDGDIVSSLGQECAGVVSAVGEDVKDFRVGDEVLGLASNSFASNAVTDSRALAKKPECLSFEEATTIPLTFLSSYHALHNLAKIQKGDRVLIHAAAGGVGMAAIQIAGAAGAEVLATAGSPEKREILHSLGIQYVGDSRQLEFASEVMEYTNHEGVDIVLNTLPATTIPLSMSILKPMVGRFVDLSNVFEKSLVIGAVDKGVSFFTFDLEKMCNRTPEYAGDMLRQILRKVELGQLRPLPHRTFPVSGFNRAIQFMRKAKHVGKIVLSMQNDASVTPTPTHDKLILHGECTYMITGGLGGFGLAMSRWLIFCGAQHLVLLGRSGDASPEIQEALEPLRKTGAEIRVVRADVTSKKQLSGAMKCIQKEMPPLKGIVHAAMVLEDASLRDMNPAQLQKVMAPKIVGAWNLHLLTKNSNLDFFISFSSMSSMIGNTDQANYAAGNIFLDYLAGMRQSQGLPGLTIGWGAIGGVGYVAQHEDIRRHFIRQGLRNISLDQAWRCIVLGLKEHLRHCGVVIVDWNTLARYSHSVAKSPRFAYLVTRTRKTEQDSLDNGVPDFASIADPEERIQALTEALRKDVAQILGVSKDKLDINQPLENLGFDSLMAVELVVQIEQTTNIEVPKMALLKKGLNVVDLVAQVEKELDATDAAPAQTAEEKKPPKAFKTPAEEGVDVDNLTDAEVNSLLDAMLSNEELNSETN